MGGSIFSLDPWALKGMYYIYLGPWVLDRMYNFSRSLGARTVRVLAERQGKGSVLQEASSVLSAGKKKMLSCENSSFV